MERGALSGSTLFSAITPTLLTIDSIASNPPAEMQPTILIPYPVGRSVTTRLSVKRAFTPPNGKLLRIVSGEAVIFNNKV